jgi:hypothetical protein
MKNIPTNKLTDNIEFAKHLYSDKMTLSDIPMTNNKTDLDRNVNDYYLNNLNFRDRRDWINNNPAEIVALGCSHTYGIGVPQEYNWPSIVEARTGKTVANLGICGASAELNLNSFLRYLDTVGKPKYVLACFPDHLRYSHITEGKFYYVNGAQDDHSKSRKVVTHLRTSDHITGEINIKDKIIKLPGDAKYLIPTQESLNQYISSIYIIEKICKFLDIKFYWGTWSMATQKIFTENLFLEDWFCLNKNNHVESIKSNSTANEFFDKENYYREVKCQLSHSMDEKDFEKYKNNMWKIGSDNNHLGIHWQHHTAESFIEWIH